MKNIGLISRLRDQRDDTTKVLSDAANTIERQDHRIEELEAQVARLSLRPPAQAAPTPTLVQRLRAKVHPEMQTLSPPVLESLAADRIEALERIAVAARTVVDARNSNGEWDVLKEAIGSLEDAIAAAPRP